MLTNSAHENTSHAAWYITVDNNSQRVSFTDIRSVLVILSKYKLQETSEAYLDVEFDNEADDTAKQWLAPQGVRAN